MTKLVHDWNCTYCKHRHVLKHKDGKHDTETCRLTNRICPHPTKGPEPRYCDKFQMIGCDCEQCTMDVRNS